MRSTGFRPGGSGVRLKRRVDKSDDALAMFGQPCEQFGAESGDELVAPDSQGLLPRVGEGAPAKIWPHVSEVVPVGKHVRLSRRIGQKRRCATTQQLLHQMKQLLVTIYGDMHVVVVASGDGLRVEHAPTVVSAPTLRRSCDGPDLALPDQVRDA